MVMLIAKNTLKPGTEQDFLALAREMTAKTRAEAGCISYELVQNQADPLVYFFIEKYADQNAVQAHRETSHFQTLVPKIAELRQKSSEVSTCTVVE